MRRFKWTFFAFDKRGQSISATRVQFVMETMTDDENGGLYFKGITRGRQRATGGSEVPRRYRVAANQGNDVHFYLRVS